MVSKFEASKDVVQELTESAATHVGNIATIVAGAVRDVTREIGDWISDGIEMREAAQAAQADRGESAAPRVEEADTTSEQ